MQKPGEATLMMEVGYLCQYAGRFREAREIFEAVRALLPRRESPEVALAAVSVAQGKFDEATAHCRSALKLNPASSAAYVQLAEIQLFQRDIATARKNLQRSIDLHPNGPTSELAAALLKLAVVPKKQAAGRST